MSMAVSLHLPKLKVRGLQLKVCSKTFDMISEVPDDILVKILSFLEMKEAGRTCVLSKRWKNTWAYVVRLNFDPGNLYQDFSMWLNKHTLDNKKWIVEKDKYVGWVDGVMNLYIAPTIYDFSLQFDLSNFSRKYIDNWLRIAVKKRVKRLELNLENFEEDRKESPYDLPATVSSLCYTLTSLQLASVDVTGEALEEIIYNCKALELLSVTNSGLLVNLKVSGPSLKLKSLRLDCSELSTLEIYAPNLVYFYYFGEELNLPLKSTPKLAEVFIGSFYCNYLMEDFSDFSRCFSQIEVLTLEITTEIQFMKVFPICNRLKILNVIFTPSCAEDLFRFSSLIKACPVLHKFVLQLEYISQVHIDMTEKPKTKEVCPHEHLKIVEIIGFIGCKIDIEFFKYLMEIAVSLEIVMIDPRQPQDIRNPKYVATPWQSTNMKNVRKALEAANQLNVNIKPGIDLLIYKAWDRSANLLSRLGWNRWY